MEPENTRWQQFAKPVNAPTFRLQSVNSGKFLTSAEVFDGITILTFVPGIWSPWCRKYLASLHELAQNSLTEQFKIVAVVSQLYDEVAEYVTENPLDLEILCDPHGVISQRYGIFDESISEPMKIARPSIFIADAKQKIHYKFLGKYLTDQPHSAEIVQYARVTQLNTQEPKYRWLLWPFIRVRRPRFAYGS